MEMKIEKDPDCKTTAEYLLYKLDRNIAVCGIVAISVLALLLWKNDAGLQVCIAGLGFLGGYVGGRSGK